MFALITPRANSTRNKNADKVVAVLSAKQACGGPLKAERPQVQNFTSSALRSHLFLHRQQSLLSLQSPAVAA